MAPGIISAQVLVRIPIIYLFLDGDLRGFNAQALDFGFLCFFINLPQLFISCKDLYVAYAYSSPNNIQYLCYTIQLKKQSRIKTLWIAVTS